MAKTFAILKDPQSVLDYLVDWSDWLGDDEISVSTFNVPSGMVLVSQANTPTDAVVWVSGGTLDAEYTVVNHITTAASRQEDAVLIFKIKNLF